MRNTKKILSAIIVACFLLLYYEVIPQSKLDSLKNKLEFANREDSLDILLDLGYSLNFSNVDLAIEYSNKSIELAEKLNNASGKGRGYSNKAICNWTNNNFNEALLLINKSYSIYKSVNDSTGMAKALLNKGLILYYKGEQLTALEILLESIKISEKLNLVSIKAIAYINLGLMYNEMGKYDIALNYNLQSEKILPPDNNNFGTLYNNIANNYINLKNYNKAEIYLKKSLKKLNNHTNIAELGFVYINYGIVKLEQKDKKAGYQYLNKSIELFKDKKNDEVLAYAHYTIGKYKRKDSNYTQSINSLDSALSHCNNSRTRELQNTIYSDLSIAYEKIGNIKKALKYSKLYADSSLSFIEKSKIVEINKLQAKFEIKEKDHENKILKTEITYKENSLFIQKIIITIISLSVIIFIFILNLLLKQRKKEKITKKILLKKNKEIYEQNETLSKLNLTKDKFFSILAHDLKNPLGVVYNYSGLLINNFDELSCTEKKEISHNIYSSIKNVNYLLENLLTWVISFNDKISINKQAININELFNSSIKPYEEFAKEKEILFVKDILGKIVINTDKFMLQTIIGNILNNAIKFSHEKSKIILNGKSKNGFVIISIQDYGVGMDEKTANNVFDLVKVKSTLGTIGEKGTGLGLVLVKDLVEKLNGKITLESTLNKGTTFFIEIPTN